jgi:phosphoglycolate phosphatase
VKTLIFDFDGTIADSFETLLGIFEEITGRKLSGQEITDLRAKPLKYVLKYLQIRRWQIPRFVLKARRSLNSKMAGIKIFSGMDKTLEQLGSGGHQMFILSTNDERNIVQFLRTNRLDGYVSKVYGNIGLRSKSSALNKIIKREKLDRQNCVYIGDEIRDIEAAKKAGITSVGVTWGFNSPDAIKNARPEILAQKPSDLTKYLTS